MFKRVIGIRTNEWSGLEQNLYNQLLQYFSAQEIFVVVDEMKNTVQTPKYIQKISWDSEFIKSHNLLDYNHFNRGIGWLAGDYFYYALENKVQADYYWLVEPDVGFSFEHLRDFFSVFEEYNDDALLAQFKGNIDDDYWYRSAQLISGDAYKCAFPLSRLSHRAIDICKVERQKLSLLYREKNAISFVNNPIGVHFPNDEVLVATTLMREGYKVRSLNDVMPDSFDYFTYHQWFSIPQKNLIQPLNNIIHPIRPISRFTDRISNEIVENLDRTSLNYSIVNLDNIDYVADSIGRIVAENIKSKLKNNLKNILLLENVKFLESIKEFVLSLLPATSYQLPATSYQLPATSYQLPATSYQLPATRSNVWIWQQETVVLDVLTDGKILSLDFHLENNKINAYIFERESEEKNWLGFFEQYYSDLTLLGKKGKLFSISVNERDNLYQEVRKAIGLIYAFINQNNKIV